MFKIYGIFLSERSWLKEHICQIYETISYGKKVIGDVQNYVKDNGEGHTFKIYGTIGKAFS